MKHIFILMLIFNREPMVRVGSFDTKKACDAAGFPLTYGGVVEEMRSKGWIREGQLVSISGRYADDYTCVMANGR